MELDKIVASRMYSWQYSAPLKMNIGRGDNRNPLADKVQKSSVYCGQAATAEMLAKKQTELDPSWRPAENYTPRFEPTAHPCVVRSLSNGELQVRILNPRTIKKELTIDGQPLTAEQMAIVKQFTPARKPSKGAKVMFPYVNHLANVDDSQSIINALDDED